MSYKKRNELTQQEKEFCFGIAQAVIAEHAPAILRRWRQIGRDLLDDADAEIWRRIERGRCDPTRGEAQVRAWCRTVLRNLLFSLGRKVRRTSRVLINDSVLAGKGEHGVIATALAQDVICPAAEVELKDYLSARFSEQDLELICRWQLRDRIELLCLAGLWRKVPEPLWQAWVRELRGGGGAPADLPSREVLVEATPQDRLAPLAKALGVRSNSLSQRWRRKKGDLQQLSCIAGLKRQATEAC